MVIQNMLPQKKHGAKAKVYGANGCQKQSNWRVFAQSGNLVSGKTVTNQVTIRSGAEQKQAIMAKHVYLFYRNVMIC